jgi:hypothetical protein
MSKLTQWFKKIGLAILTGIRRFPITVGAAVAITIIALIFTHQSDTMAQATQKWLVRIIMTLSLGIPLSVALQLAFERCERLRVPLRAAIWAVLGALLALYLFFLLPDAEKAMYSIRFASLMLASIAVVPAVPYFMKRQGDERFALKLLLRLLITGLFTAILIGGIFLVLFMLEKLLNVTLEKHAYIDTAILCAGLFAPSFFLAGVPRGDHDFVADAFHPLVRILIGYILFPLLAIYTAIIYAYFVRILILWSWPSNMLVRMVLWYTIIGVLSVYFMRSQVAANRWFSLFDTWYPRLTVLPIVLMFVGFFIRTGAYGYTEPRYFVLVAAIWVTAVTMLAIFYKAEKRVNVLAPALLAALAVLAVIGPWSAFSISANSQNSRLEAILKQNGMLAADGKVTAKTTISDADKLEIYSILDYFEGTPGLEKARALPAGATVATLPQVLGFDRANSPGSANASYYISSGMVEDTIDISGYDSLFVGNYNKSPTQPTSGLVLAVDSQSVFTVSKDGAVLYTKDLKEYAKSLEGGYVQGKTYTVSELTWTDENSSVKVKFIINEATINYANGVPTYAVPNFYALVKVK